MVHAEAPGGMGVQPQELGWAKVMKLSTVLLSQQYYQLMCSSATVHVDICVCASL